MRHRTSADSEKYILGWIKRVLFQLFVKNAINTFTLIMHFYVLDIKIAGIQGGLSFNYTLWK